MKGHAFRGHLTSSILLALHSSGCIQPSNDKTKVNMQETAEHAPQESVGRQMLGFCIHHWEKAAILAFLITLIILVCVKVWTAVSLELCCFN